MPAIPPIVIGAAWLSGRSPGRINDHAQLSTRFADNARDKRNTLSMATVMNLENIRIVLTRTSHPGNIGAAARAMKNMGLSDLALVNPLSYPSAEATARASGADDLLIRAGVFTKLDEAIADCRLVLGASARERSLPWPMTDAHDGAARALLESAHGKVAVVFGNEQSGLSNDELDRCQALLHIPANSDYSSLNLAQAVQVVSYEMMMASRDAKGERLVSVREHALASGDELQRFYTQLEAVLIQLEFLDPENPRHLMRRLRRLFARASPDENEMNILRGILSHVRKRLPGE